LTKYHRNSRIIAAYHKLKEVRLSKETKPTVRYITYNSTGGYRASPIRCEIVDGNVTLATKDLEKILERVEGGSSLTDESYAFPEPIHEPR